MQKTGFDNEKYLQLQTDAILERAAQSGNKLYLEFGGKLMYDHHAERVLPGYDPNVKLRLLQKLKDQAEIILCVHAGDIERKKMRADFGITYDDDALKLIDDLRAWDILVSAVVITRFDGQQAAILFHNKLKKRGIHVYCHRTVPGYPGNLDLIVSKTGYGSNAYVPTTRPIVVVTGPGPGSGKLATCLTLLYHDRTAGRAAGYAKFETFPVWNLPLKHPVNLAYEAATADLGDQNMIDPFHLDAHGIVAINYNRDIEAYPLLRAIWNRLESTQSCPYASPTDMGVNCVGFGISDDDTVRKAAKQEVIRRYFHHLCDSTKKGDSAQQTVERIERLMSELDIAPEDRAVVNPAREAARQAALRPDKALGIHSGAALQLKDGRIITGRSSRLLHAAASTMLNAVKTLAHIPDRIHLIAPQVVDSIVHMKRDILKGRHTSLNLDEALIGLAISAAVNPTAQDALDRLIDLRDCELHLSHMLTPGDEAGLRRLGIRSTTDPLFPSAELFIDS